jgi:hypothetical protein
VSLGGFFFVFEVNSDVKLEYEQGALGEFFFFEVMRFVDLSMEGERGDGVRVLANCNTKLEYEQTVT